MNIALAALLLLLPAPPGPPAAGPASAPPPAEAVVQICDTWVAATGIRGKEPATVDAEIGRRKDLEGVLRSLPFGTYTFLGEACSGIKVGETVRFDLPEDLRLLVTRKRDEADQKVRLELRQEKGEALVTKVDVGIFVGGYYTQQGPRLSGERNLVQILSLRKP